MVPSIALVIPVHVGGDTFRRCMAAVARLRPAPTEVVVVVDGPDVGESRVARACGARVLWTGERAGPAAARNLGVSATSADVLFFIDADVLVPQNAVAVAAEYFAAHPTVHAAIGSYDDDPPERNLASQYKNLLNHHRHQRAPLEGHTFWGACGIIRRDSFEALGGFREAYSRPSIEDTELGYRLRAAGGQIHVLAHLQVGHMKRWQWGALLRSDVRDRALPWSELILLNRHVEAGVDVAARAKVTLTGLSTLAALAAVAAPAAPAAGAALVLLVVAVLLDRPLWRFLRDRRGAGFVLRVMPWHVFSHLYSGAAFGLGAVRHVVTTRQRRRARREGRPLAGHSAARLPSADVRVRTPTPRP
ncbi:MAG: glycosyltransferase [Egibacteraceae bacterium]